MATVVDITPCAAPKFSENTPLTGGKGKWYLYTQFLEPQSAQKHEKVINSSFLANQSVRSTIDNEKGARLSHNCATGPLAIPTERMAHTASDWLKS